MIAFIEFGTGDPGVWRQNSMVNVRELRLTPEEDSIGDPDEQDDEIDDLLPADLWFREADNRRHPLLKAEPRQHA